MGTQAVICDIKVLFQAWHAFLYLNINPSVVFDRLQVVLVYDFLQDVQQLYLHVIVLLHRAFIIAIIDVKCAKKGTQCGHCDDMFQD